MTSTGYINAKEALEVLGLYNPASGTKPNSIYLTYLNRRGLLKRFKVGHRTISYRKVDCENLFKKACNEGIILTAKPVKA
jgi:hypothetical protein